MFYRIKENLLTKNKRRQYLIKTAVGHEDVAVRIESEKIAETLHSDDCAGYGIDLKGLFEWTEVRKITIPSPQKLSRWYLP